MPRIRRKGHNRKRRRGLELDADTRMFLRFGWTFFDDSICMATDAEELHRLWSENRDSLLQEHITETPGTRPLAWWRWDRPAEELRVVAKWPGVADDVLRLRDEFGCNYSNIGRRVNGTFQWLFERENVYLARHNLLTSDERQAIESQGAHSATN